VTPQPSLTPAAFAAKWRGITTTEKASAHEHFIDLCRMLGEPTPHEADPIGAQYAPRLMLPREREGLFRGSP
jgi:hypothetical protein